MNQKSILAKLLATENITVQHGNYETAWFDIKDRVLGLPQWKDMGKDVYDLLIGHEVGHALNTPYEGWHDSPEKLEGCPRSYINVVEDARIERKIKSKYVGLVGPFARGYAKLFDEGLFGKDHDFNKLKLIDKINLKAKVGAHLDIPFNDLETVLYNKTMKTDTFADVIEVVKEILAYTKEHQPELMEQPEPDIDMNLPTNNDGEDEPQMGHDDMELPSSEEENQETSEEKTFTNTESADSEETDDRKEDNNSSSESDDEETLSAEEGSPETKPANDQLDESITDGEFRRRERSLLDGEDRYSEFTQPKVYRQFSKKALNYMIVDHKRLAENRKKKIEQYDSVIEDYLKEYYDNDRSESKMQKYAEYDKDFNEYYKAAKKSVTYAVKEFEQKKAAYRWTRASVAKTGNLDVNKLWSYKTNEDIFNRVTRLADAKNHGMIALIDYSGSMSSCMGDVLDQMIHIGLFCKAVNIPFTFYGFTDTNVPPPSLSDIQSDSEVNARCMSLPVILSSDMKKTEWMEALKHCYVRKVLSNDWYHFPGERGILAHEEEYGSTPLNEALVAITQITKQFKKTHGVDKFNLVVISDGDANQMRSYEDPRVKDKKVITDYRSGILHLDGVTIKSPSMGRPLTVKLLENLQKRYNANTLGFFICDSSNEWKYKLEEIHLETGGENFGVWCDEFKEVRKKFMKEYSKNKCIQAENMKGYKKYYLLKGGRTLNTEAEEFDPQVGSTKGSLTSAFKKHSRSKKSNKALLTSFGGSVAQ